MYERISCDLIEDSHNLKMVCHNNYQVHIPCCQYFYSEQNPIHAVLELLYHHSSVFLLIHVVQWIDVSNPACLLRVSFYLLASSYHSSWYLPVPGWTMLFWFIPFIGLTWGCKGSKCPSNIVCYIRIVRPPPLLSWRGASKYWVVTVGERSVPILTFRHCVSCILGQAFHYSPENAFYIFNQQIYFIIWYLLDRASLI